MFETYTDDIKKRSQQFSDSQSGGNIIWHLKIMKEKKHII
jgi:hypothetical protein